MLCTTGTKTIRSTETTQTGHTDATHSLALWISIPPTVKILDDYTATTTNESRHKVQSTKDFIDIIKTVQIPDDHKLVSFDVKSLFTSIPLQLALDCNETAITNSTHELPLPKENIMDLLKLCLTCSFFQYNDKHYKQLHGTAMGSPVSGVEAEIVMQNIEQQALATYKETLPFWLRYVDDTFTAVHKDEIDFLHEHLNKQNTYIQFTWEIEENGKIPFLDCLVSRDNHKLRTTIYRKPTNTDRLLDQCSYHPTCHKATAVRTLTRRAHLVCDSPNSLSSETKHLHDVFHKNNYNEDFISRNYYRDNGTPDQQLLQWRQYHTSRVPPKPSHESYNHTTSTLLTNR